MSSDVNQIREEVQRQADKIQQLRSEIGQVMVGQESMITRLLVGLLAGGHVLLEGVPGLAAYRLQPLPAWQARAFAHDASAGLAVLQTE